jgi:hypothetical protein
MKIGQMIALRSLLCMQLQIMAKVGQNSLYLCIENLNNAIMNDMTLKLKRNATDTTYMQ